MTWIPHFLLIADFFQWRGCVIREQTMPNPPWAASMFKVTFKLCDVMLHYMPRSTVLTWQISNIPINFLALELGEIKVTFHVNLCKCRNLKCWSYGQQGAYATSALSLWDFCCIWAQVTLIPFNLWRWPEPDLQSFLSHSLCTHLDLLILLPFQHCTLCRF